MAAVSGRLPSLGPRGEGWFAAQLALIAATGIAGLASGGAWSGPARAAGAVVGGALLALGGAVVVGGALRLGPGLTPLPRPRDDAELVEEGLYAFVRHPIYAGVMSAGLGWALLTASPTALALSATLAGLLDLKARREEAWLLERFPGYEAYRARTRRFVPGLY